MTSVRAHKGFTLLEMMVVVAIIGVVAALAVPNLITLVRRSTVSSEASVLGGTIGSLRTQAIVRGFPTIVCVRGPTYAGGTLDEAGRLTTYRKIRNPAVGSAINPLLAGYDTTAPADVLVESRREDPAVITNVPTAITGVNANATVQIVFDNTGAVSVWAAPDCLATSSAMRNPIAIPAAGFPLTIASAGDAAVTQDVVLVSDGTVKLP